MKAPIGAQGGSRYCQDTEAESLASLNTRRPDVQRRAAELFATLGPRISAVEDRFAKQFGWNLYRANQLWETNPAHKAGAQAFAHITRGAAHEIRRTEPLH